MNPVLAYLIVFLFGALVGIAELVSRYRDEPGKAILSVPGFLYLFVNIGAACLALYMIDIFGWDFGVDENSTPAARRMVQILVAGFGSIALFRSALFTVRLGENDINVGPSAFLQILLNACDRAVDRSRASSRAVKVAKTMNGLTFNDAKTALPALCFGLMQNLDPEQQQTAGKEILSLIDDATLTEDVKLMCLGLTLMNLVGENVLNDAVKAFKKEIN